MKGLPADVLAKLRALPFEKIEAAWLKLEAAGDTEADRRAMVRALCLGDLYYLLVRAMGRRDMLHPWVYARTREVEASPNGHLDLWSREHYKSTIITFGLTIQDILNDPDITFGLFSHTRPIAKAFLRQIKLELESNRLLQTLFPDVLWGNPQAEAPKWSEDDGIIVRRRSNPAVSTVEAWGVVDGQPTGKHFKRLLYDDVVVPASVTSPEMIVKTMEALELSYNLGASGGERRMAGTRYHFNDAYKTVQDRGSFKLREHPGRVGGVEDGAPVLWSEEVHQQKRRDMGPYTYATQILLNPKADALQGFKREWLRHYTKMTESAIVRMTGYILVDAASAKKSGSDYTSMWVIGLGEDKNRYALDMVRDRLNLPERAARLIALHRKWMKLGLKLRPVRYEKYGMMADTEHIRSRMEDENYRFPIIEVGGSTPKADRIKRLLPIFEQGRMWLPQSLYVTDYQKQPVDLVRAFVEEEYMAFPVGLHDDMLDALARMEEPDERLTWPRPTDSMGRESRGETQVARDVDFDVFAV